MPSFGFGFGFPLGSPPRNGGADGAPVFDPDPAAIAWAGAQMVGYQTGDLSVSSPAAVMRRTFTPAKPVQKATLQATALGTYIPYMNGQRVGDLELTPGWTDYAKRRHFQTYDVTRLLTSGTNTVGVEVGDGWAHGNQCVVGRHVYGVDTPRAMVALRLAYADGTSETIVSDGSWKATTSDNRSNDQFNGSTHDARLRKDWSNPATSDAAWASVSVATPGSAPLEKQPSPPARRHEALVPIARTSPSAGVYIFDFGQNHAGYCTIRVDGAASGTAIKLRHAEDLKTDGSGTLYTANLRTAAATDTFICAGGGSETFEPRHTYHGYRYVEVTGYPGIPPLDCITSHAIYNDAPFVSTFATSSPVLQASWNAAVWAWKSNAITIPTDCPQRDERMGWTADIHLFSRAATYIQDSAAFLGKYCDDMDDSAVSGKVGDVAPFVAAVGRGQAGWGEAAAIIPWTLYQVYGDPQHLSRHAATMQAMLPALPYNGATYNDYLNINQPTDSTLFANAFAYRAADFIKRSADVLGNTALSAAAAQKVTDFGNAYRSFVSNGGAIIGNESQTSYILGLAFGILPANQKAAAASALVAKINQDGLRCGFVGLTYLFDVLADAGYLDLAYQLAEKNTAPSLGHQLSTGLTTVAEQWNPRSLQGVNDGANSYNHFVRGAVVEWIARTVAGIDTLEPGFTRPLLRPRPGGQATSASLAFKSPVGEIRTDWKLENGTLIWGFVLPVTSVVVVPPGFDAGQLATASGATALADDAVTGGLRFQMPAGIYAITAAPSPGYVTGGYVQNDYVGAN